MVVIGTTFCMIRAPTIPYAQGRWRNKAEVVVSADYEGKTSLPGAFEYEETYND